ncbi:MAG: hypothetical protein EU532_06035 [Promethearchaeota archaeon]|nr:MAG: hypothetical protein EU532_06035 [Candidatus Lokiarchaeota archaeon]
MSLFIYVFNHKFTIKFDAGILKERQEIIQFLANYVMYDRDEISGMSFIFSIWIIVALIPVINFDDYKSAYSTNLYTFFFPNFFFYIFLNRYSPNSFNSYFPPYIINTLILGLFLLIFTIGISILLNKTIRNKKKSQLEDFKKIAEKIEYTCPNCGTKFNSIPVYCFNCLKELTVDEISNGNRQ